MDINKESNEDNMSNQNHCAKKFLRAGMLLDHISKISTYRKKMKNGYAVDLYSAEPGYVLDKCSSEFDIFAEQFASCDSANYITEKCDNAINTVIKCFSKTMDEYFDETSKY